MQALVGKTKDSEIDFRQRHPFLVFYASAAALSAVLIPHGPFAFALARSSSRVHTRHWGVFPLEFLSPLEAYR